MVLKAKRLPSINSKELAAVVVAKSPDQLRAPRLINQARFITQTFFQPDITPDFEFLSKYSRALLKSLGVLTVNQNPS